MPVVEYTHFSIYEIHFHEYCAQGMHAQVVFNELPVNTSVPFAFKGNNVYASTSNIHLAFAFAFFSRVDQLTMHINDKFYILLQNQTNNRCQHFCQSSRYIVVQPSVTLDSEYIWQTFSCAETLSLIIKYRQFKINTSPIFCICLQNNINRNS